MSVERSYAVLAGRYDEAYAPWRAVFSAARDELLRRHGLVPAAVLDVGCGSGWQSLELARRGARVVAVDPEPLFLDVLRRSARKERLPVEVRPGDALRLPLRPDERFDLVLATFDVLNHLRRKADLGPALSSAARSLAPGGHLLFDLVTPATLASFPDHHRVTRFRDGTLSAESGSFDPATGTGTLLRDWFLPERGKGKPAGRPLRRHVRERYREIAWEREEVREALRCAGLVARLFADASGWLSVVPRGTRWIVVARRRVRRPA